MRTLRSLPVLLALALALAAPLAAQRPGVVHRTPGDTVRNSYRVHEAEGAPRGVLVLVPGYGGSVDSFDPASGYSPSTLPATLARQGVMTVVAVPDPETLFETDAPVRALDAMVAEVVARYRVPRWRVVVGGFSAGGTAAVRLAQLCAADGCQGADRLAGVFAVDSPLDFERLWRGEELAIGRAAPASNLEEARMILDTLRRGLGGSPDEAPAAYRARSPVLASALDGGNARLLAGTPVRLYTEPDVGWWIENRNLDYGGMNSVDHAALVNLLRIAGNRRAELIATTGRGVRPDGRRHPHSWSIVDEPELAGWILALVGAEAPCADCDR